MTEAEIERVALQSAYETCQHFAALFANGAKTKSAHQIVMGQMVNLDLHASKNGFQLSQVKQ